MAFRFTIIAYVTFCTLVEYDFALPAQRMKRQSNSANNASCSPSQQVLDLLETSADNISDSYFVISQHLPHASRSQHQHHPHRGCIDRDSPYLTNPDNNNGPENDGLCSFVWINDHNSSRIPQNLPRAACICADGCYDQNDTESNPQRRRIHTGSECVPILVNWKVLVRRPDSECRNGVAEFTLETLRDWPVGCQCVRSL